MANVSVNKYHNSVQEEDPTAGLGGQSELQLHAHLVKHHTNTDTKSKAVIPSGES